MKSKSPAPSHTQRQTGRQMPAAPRQIPQSLAVQTVAILREKVHSGYWPRLLPSEQKLGDWLVVGRGTVRTALICLAQEGLIRSRHGTGWEIVSPRPKPPTRSGSKNLVLLSRVSLTRLGIFQLFWIDSLREHLQDAGYHLEIRHDAACFTARPGNALQELSGRIRPAGWVLFSVPAQVQRWFSEQNLPAVIVGSRHEGVSLPAIERDFAAVSRHAVGMLLCKGRTRLVLLAPKSRMAGDVASESSFRKAAEPALRHLAGEALVAYHDGSPQGIHRRLTALLRRRPQPTGMLVAGNNKHTLGALSFLLRQGVRVPEQMALIGRDSDPFFEYVLPTLARYVTDPMIFARKVSRMVLRLAQGGAVLPKVYHVMPTFVPGETLGR